jgi:hypothetical protein
VSVRVTDTDRGLRETVKRLRGRFGVRVGVLNPSAPHGSSTVGEVAAATEFGAPARDVPMQSFVRAPIDAHERDLRALEKSEAQKIIAGKTTPAAAAQRIAARAKAIMRSSVPVKTGELRDAIDAEVEVD